MDVFNLYAKLSLNTDDYEKGVEKAKGDLTYSRCGKLADLYTIRREHTAPERQQAEAAVQTASEIPARVRAPGSSDFMRVVAKVDFGAALDVLDELMSATPMRSLKRPRTVCTPRRPYWPF